MDKRFSLSLFLLVLFMFTIFSTTDVDANPGVTINISHSPFLGKPVHIEYNTDRGEDGTIVLFIKNPDGDIVWSFGPQEIAGGNLYNVTVVGVTEKLGYYFVHAEVTLESGKKISNIVPFSKIERIDTSIEQTESHQDTSVTVESSSGKQSSGFYLQTFNMSELNMLLITISVLTIIILLIFLAESLLKNTISPSDL